MPILDYVSGHTSYFFPLSSARRRLPSFVIRRKIQKFKNCREKRVHCFRLDPLTCLASLLCPSAPAAARARPHQVWCKSVRFGVRGGGGCPAAALVLSRDPPRCHLASFVPKSPLLFLLSHTLLVPSSSFLLAARAQKTVYLPIPNFLTGWACSLWGKIGIDSLGRKLKRWVDSFFFIVAPLRTASRPSRTGTCSDLPKPTQESSISYQVAGLAARC